MRIRPQPSRRGVALIIVMLVIATLAALALSFADSMAVETRLARNTNYDSDFDWIGRSGIEYARYILGLQMGIQNEPYDSLGQKWAGGRASTNDIMQTISMENNELGPGKFSLKIIDRERKFNVNIADQTFLKQAFTLVGVDPSYIPPIVDCVLDWRDPDDDTHLDGAESDYYLTLKPPYQAKNGPIDDLSEMMLIKGITPEMFNGSGTMGSQVNTRRSAFGLNRGNAAFYTNALVDIFTPLSAGKININTVSPTVLQMFPGIDAATAEAMVRTRQGPDQVDGTEDDTPLPNLSMLGSVPGLSQTGIANLSRYLSVRSATFEVHVTIEIDGHTREMIGILYRTSPKDIRLLFTYWN